MLGVLSEYAVAVSTGEQWLSFTFLKTKRISQ